jgi:hypothetical protein
MYSRKIVVLLMVLATSLVPASSQQQDLNIFRIGTGGMYGTYYPVGGLIGQAISNPPGTNLCASSDVCGVPGLLAVAQVSSGSVSNIMAIDNGSLEAGLAQSDVAYWAYSGTGVFSDQAPVSDLRAIATLYPEHVHIVTRQGTGISSVADLKNRRVSLGAPGSGTLVDARIILDAFGLSEQDIKPQYQKPDLAIERLRDDKLDAFFIVAGYPVPSLVASKASDRLKLIPIPERERSALVAQYSFFKSDAIPAKMYPGISNTPTISVSATLVTSSRIDKDLVYEITRALWNENSRTILDQGHMKGRSITLETALDGLGIPLHAGALRYYQEQGLIAQ